MGKFTIIELEMKCGQHEEGFYEVDKKDARRLPAGIQTYSDGVVGLRVHHPPHTWRYTWEDRCVWM